MCNVVNKWAILAALTIALTGCGSSATQSRQAAEQMVAEAEAAIEQQRYADAITILDSLQSQYPTEVEIQRRAMNVRPKAIEGLTIREIETNDSLLAIATWKVDSLTPLFKEVANPQLVESYRIAKTSNDQLFSGSTVVARLSEDGEFYLISTLNGNAIKHTSISLSGGGNSVTSATVAFDNAQNYRSGSNEMITFSAAQCDTLGQFAANHDNAKLSLTFHGNRDYTTTLTATEVHAIADTYRMANALGRKRQLSKQQELLRAKLQLARDQQARTMPDDAANKADK
jgi:hypothetical protein